MNLPDHASRLTFHTGYLAPPASHSRSRRPTTEASRLPWLSWSGTLWVHFLLLIVVLVAFDFLPLPDSFRNDTQTVQDLARHFVWRQLDETESQSYLRTAKFFLFFEPLTPRHVAILVAYLYLLAVFSTTRDPFVHLILVALTTPAVLLTLPFAQKDTIANLVSTLTYLSLTALRSPCRALFVIALLYITCAYAIRPYYIPAFLGALFLFLLSRRILSLRIVLLGSTLIATILLASGHLGDFYLYPQIRRDDVNLHRVIATGEGFRTAFLNPLPPDSFINFLGNYVYAFIYLNVPIIFMLDVKAILMTTYMTCLLTICIYSLRRSNNGPAKFAVLLIFSHIFVNALFEPDLGSYLRHMSTLIPLVAIALKGLLSPATHPATRRTSFPH